MRAEVFRVIVAEAGRVRRGETRWVAPPGFKDLGLSNFTRKTLAVGLGQKPDNRAFRP